MIKFQQIPTIELIKTIPDYENMIFSYYIPDYASGNKMFRGLFRKDPNASANIIKYGDRLIYKDFGETESYDCFSFVAKYYGCKLRDTAYYIDKDLNLGIYSNTGVTRPTQPKTVNLGTPNKSGGTILQVKKRDWLDYDIEYWNQYKLTVDSITKYNIFPISTIFITKEGIQSIYPADKYSYSFDFYWHKGVFRRKIYQPYVKDIGKWYSNINNTVIQGIKNIPKEGKNLIITKGLKDVMVWNEVYGIPAVASNNESTFILEEKFYKLKGRFDNIYINYDNDAAGIKNSTIFSDKYDIPNLIIPQFTNVTDISDLIKYSETECNSYVKSLKLND